MFWHLSDDKTDDYKNDGKRTRNSVGMIMMYFGKCSITV
jgi:hypothetical protein